MSNIYENISIIAKLYKSTVHMPDGLIQLLIMEMRKCGHIPCTHCEVEMQLDETSSASENCFLFRINSTE